LSWIEGDFGAVKGSVHESDDFGIVESGGAFEPDVANDVAASQKAMARIWNAGALKKAETDVAGIKGDREDGIGRPLVWNETDHKGIVIVIDHFEGAGETLAHCGERATS